MIVHRVTSTSTISQQTSAIKQTQQQLYACSNSNMYFPYDYYQYLGEVCSVLYLVTSFLCPAEFMYEKECNMLIK